MSVHFRGTCTVVDDVICYAPCETKWNKTQPQLVMRSFTHKVDIVNNKAIIG